MEPPLKIATVKSSITGIEWKTRYIPSLKSLVLKVHTLVTHTYALLKYIFTEELENNMDFALQDLANVDFFREVFISLLDSYKPDKAKRKEKARSYKELTNKHRDTYCQLASYVPIKLKYAQQIGSYEATKIHTAYMNGVALHFENRLRMFLNLLLKKQERIGALKSEMKKKNCTESEISTAVKTIASQCIKVKMNISLRSITELPTHLFNSQEIGVLQQFFDCYPSDTHFKKNSIYCDCKADPSKHLKAFYYLTRCSESLYNKSFNCFPLRRTFIPSYMTIDTYTVITQILRNSAISYLDKEVIWGAVLNMKSKAMKPQGDNKQIKFRGIIYTDGIAVSILKQTFDSKKKGSGGDMRNDKKIEEDIAYIESLSQEKLRERTYKDNCVLIDPGRRDMLFCMHESSTVEKKRAYRYTKNQRNIETKTRKFMKLYERLKPEAVSNAEAILSRLKSPTVIKDQYVEYIKQKATVTQVLQEYYSNEDLPLEEPTLIDSNLTNVFSAGNVKFHEPIRGVGMRRMLQKEGFLVHLIDEFKTCSICPVCKGDVETFKEVVNPRPFRREKYPTVKRHGLLRCKNEQCLKEDRRLWNRDLLAALNFSEILFSLRDHGANTKKNNKKDKDLLLLKRQ
ncbi:uncharacterized protein B0P05DRAFT_634361 [Gilbertella persicaria]|uniref:uncharacterized protein n=2 Tax=Gilbertella persicaria TaxID=101096 RepID=UPI002220E951|nr:uncharacterized protein B0P05DRAFT_634361 [Gilbertella persicaria]KAI8091231.1 hypothetical protein B0P05DRAFT_634361 [Gilbertella persicaria]